MAPQPQHDRPLLRQLLRRPHQVLPVLVMAPLVQAAPLVRQRTQQQQQQQQQQQGTPSTPHPRHEPAGPPAHQVLPVHSKAGWKSQALGWHTAAVGAVGFAAVTADVFGSPLFESMHVLAGLDAWGHQAAQAIEPTLRYWLMDRAVSDTFIVAGLFGWSALTLHLALNPKPEASTPVAVMGLAWTFYGLFAGRVDGDPWLIASLKAAFHRARPSALHRTMSFPSGHTTSATFLVASLVFVLLPVLLHKSDPDTRGWAYQVMQKMQGSWSVFAASWITTATGRVLGDAHWVSDTLAAGFLSLAVASVLAKATEALITALDGEPEGADTEAGIASGAAGAGSGVVGAGLGDAAGGDQPHQAPPRPTAPGGN